VMKAPAKFPEVALSMRVERYDFPIQKHRWLTQ